MNQNTFLCGPPYTYNIYVHILLAYIANNQLQAFMVTKIFRKKQSYIIGWDRVYMTQSKIPWPVGGHLAEKSLVTYLSSLNFCGRPYKLKIPSTFWICIFQNLISNGLANNRHRTPKNRSKTVILSELLKFKQLQNVNLIEICSC